MKRKKGFTLIEILIILAIIGIIVAVVLVGWATSSQKKTAVSSMKTTVNSLAAAMEICSASEGNFQNGSSGDNICSTGSADLLYPEFTQKCGDQPHICVIGTSNNWSFTTYTSSSCSSLWSCKGCRPVCSPGGCQFMEDNPGDC